MFENLIGCVSLSDGCTFHGLFSPFSDLVVTARRRSSFIREIALLFLFSDASLELPASGEPNAGAATLQMGRTLLPTWVDSTL